MQAAHYIGQGCNVVLCLQNLKNGTCIEGEPVSAVSIILHNIYGANRCCEQLHLSVFGVNLPIINNFVCLYCALVICCEKLFSTKVKYFYKIDS